jgi:M6 family metalloprotease-like protein
MVSFTDDTLTYTPQDFNYSLFDTTHSTPTGSVYDYYQWVSRGRLKVLGQVVAKVRLPHDRAYYGSNSWGLSLSASPQNMWGAIRDALMKCDSLVNWSDFDNDHDGYVDMLWLLHAGFGGEAGRSRNDFWSLTSRMSAGWLYGGAYETPQLVPGSTTQHMRVDRFSSVPEISAFHPTQHSEIGVFCHEFGHALGLPDLYDTSQLGGAANVGPGNWSLMSTGGYGTNGYTPERPAHLDAWSMLFLGWTSSIQPSEDALLTLPPIEDTGPVVQFWFQGEANPEHFLIENRQRLDYDQYMPNPGLLVYHVDDATIGSRLVSNRVNTGLTPGIQVVEADGGYAMTQGLNRGDPGDPFPGSTGNTSLDDETSPSTRTFAGAFTNIGISDITPLGTSMRFQLNVRAPGWLGIEDHTDASFNPVGFSGAGTSVVCDTFGTMDAVQSENRAGIPQIILRERRQGVWETPVQVSASPTGADEPTLASLPGGDIAVAWRDVRGGSPRIFYRARVRGAWSAEQAVGGIAVNSFLPAISSDPQGWVYLAWLTAVKGRPTVEFMRFTYASPFGTAAAITDTSAYPDAPVMAAAPDGRAYVIWSDRGVNPQTLRFSRFEADSGVSTPATLVPIDGSSQLSVCAAVDSRQQLHVLWQEIGDGDAALHYQRRTPSTIPLRDTTIEMQGNGILNPTFAVDPQGGVHFAYETTIDGTQEIRYKHWTDDHGWDFGSTEVTRPSDGGSRQPRLAAFSPGDVSVLFTGYPSSSARFMTRDRRLEGVPLTAAPGVIATTPLAFAIGPNPLRAGASFEMRGSIALSAGHPTVDLYDLAGRRLATLKSSGEGGAWRLRVDGSITSTWPPGLYFARVRGQSGMARLVVLR